MADANEPVEIGIDLGTTHCCVAYVNKNGIVEIIANNDGHRTTPSYIVLDETEIRVGKVAKDEFYTNPKNVVYDSKRLIGRKFNDKYIQDDMKNWTFKVKESNSEPIIELSLNGEPVCYKPQEISAMLLVHMKKVAEEYIGQSVTNTVITVPAHFNYHQRTATAEAGKLAGLNVLGIINEPTAAALAYIHKNQIKNDRNILVFDLGGGTFDVSLVQMKSNRTTVAATGGNTHLGGRDFENNLKNLICKKIMDDYGENCLKSEITNRRIRQATENMKIRLSSINRATLDLQYLHDGKDVELSVTREEFEEANVDLFNSTLDIVQNCLTDAEIGKAEIDDIVLVGGSTRIPKLQTILSEFFDGKTLCKTINPDEAVAYGAAIQATKFSGNKIEALVTVDDITSLSLGVDVQGGLMSVLIPRNSKIPATATETFCLIADKATKVKWDIYEGERSFVSNNVHIGSCTLYIPPKPPGYTVDLTFHVDEDGILEVSAQEKSGRHTSLSIAYEKCNPHVVSDMINDAKTNEFSDMVKSLIANRWTDIRNYCTKLRAICNYDKKDMSDEDKGILRDTANKYWDWCKKFSVADSTLLDFRPLVNKYEKIHSISEPILKKYHYDIRDLSWDEFHELITEE